jgi:hypothetical protein
VVRARDLQQSGVSAQLGAGFVRDRETGARYVSHLVLDCQADTVVLGVLCRGRPSADLSVPLEASPCSLR